MTEQVEIGAIDTGPDRSELLRNTVQLSIQAVFGLARLDEQQVSQLLGSLVRSKLLTADDSYRLRDRLLDSTALTRYLDSRIEASLRKRGIIN